MRFQDLSREVRLEKLVWLLTKSNQVLIYMVKLLGNQFWNPVYQWVSSWGGSTVQGRGTTTTTQDLWPTPPQRAQGWNTAVGINPPSDIYIYILYASGVFIYIRIDNTYTHIVLAAGECFGQITDRPGFKIDSHPIWTYTWVPGLIF